MKRRNIFVYPGWQPGVIQIMLKLAGGINLGGDFRLQQAYMM